VSLLITSNANHKQKTETAQFFKDMNFAEKPNIYRTWLQK